MSGCVLLVGAGPGDPDLLTVRAARELARAEVLLYDALIDPTLLELVPPACERIDVGKRGDGTRGVAQESISELMIERAREGRRVVRLKGGDPFVFGRGGEEASALRAAGVEFEVVPGITSAFAVPAYAGIPVTDRRLASSVAVVTGHRGKAKNDERVDWEGLARSADTLIVLMGTAWLGDITARLIAGGRDASTPAALISNGTSAQQRVVQAPLGELAARVAEAGLRAPSIAVIGPVAALREPLAWFERRPLFARRVLVARAPEQRAALVLGLRRRGADPICVPLLEFDALERAPLRAALEREWDWIVFTSANAVRFAAPSLPPTPGRARVACVGPSTADAVRRLGWSVDVQPAKRSLPAELARAMEQRAPLRDARVLFPRGARARDELVRELRSQGAEVHGVDVYDTRMPERAPDALRRVWAHGLDAAALTSPSSAEHLCAALAPEARAELLERVVFACIGPTTALAARELGARRVVVASEQTDDALVEVLERAFGEERDGVS
jgi:uroporphyrinogen III methyltransferase/synthase